MGTVGQAIYYHLQSWSEASLTLLCKELFVLLCFANTLEELYMCPMHKGIKLWGKVPSQEK